MISESVGILEISCGEVLEFFWDFSSLIQIWHIFEIFSKSVFDGFI